MKVFFGALTSLAAIPSSAAAKKNGSASRQEPLPEGGKTWITLQD
jgi:hypothetical protein